MNKLWGNNPTGAQTANAQEGDIYISGDEPNVRQRRRAGAGWVFIVPPDTGQPRNTLSDTRGDAIPPGGQINDRLALVGAGRNFETGWLNAALGVIGPDPDGRFHQPIEATEWEVPHGLGSVLVDVTVISHDGDHHEPEVEFVTDMVCKLHFHDPVAGTAIIRR